MKNYSVAAAVCALLALSACSTPKNFNYMSDLKPGQTITLPKVKEMRISPEDKLSIVVKSSNMELNNLFNKSLNQNMEGGNPEANQYMSGYMVDRQGDVEFPVLGTLHLGGKTRHEAEAYIAERLRASKQLTDAVVNVEFNGLTFNALGEFRAPGAHRYTKNTLTILEAIGMSGDLSQYAVRDSLMVIREEDGVQKVYCINLGSAESVYNSPAFYIQQNDVLYAKANKTRIRQSTTNGNSMFSASFWISIASVLTTLAVLVFN